MTVLLGDATVESVENAVPQGYVEAFKFVADATGTISSGSLYIDGVENSATSFRIGVYDDNNGEPGSLISYVFSPISVTADDWNGAGMHQAGVTQGDSYWLAVLSGNGQLGIRTKNDETNGVAKRAGDGTLTNLPSSWPGTTQTDPNVVSGQVAGTTGV